MTIRLASPLTELDNQQLAALLAPSLLRPMPEDTRPKPAKPEKAGTSWLLWAEVAKGHATDDIS